MTDDAQAIAGFMLALKCEDMNFLDKDGNGMYHKAFKIDMERLKEDVKEIVEASKDVDKIT